MKNLLLISGFLCISALTNLTAQQAEFHKVVLDTILANDCKNVALFFPDPIRQGITGSENFVFNYNRENQQHLGLLQATPGKESNLLVISNSGSVFSYIIKYSEQLEKLNYFIPDTCRIGKEYPDIPGEIVENKEHNSEIQAEKFKVDKASYYQNFSSFLLRNKQRIGRIKKRREAVVLKVENIVFDRDELYFVFSLENRSSIDFELSFLSISVETRKRGKRRSLQKLVQEPVFEYQVPDKVFKGKTSKFVIVLPKFSIAEDKVVVIDLKEKNGERDINLKVRKRFINNPN